MTVLHAIALLGARPEVSQSVYLQAELVRQEERQKKAERALVRNLIRVLVLKSEKGERSPVTIATLAQLTDPKTVRRLTTQEANVRAVMKRLRRMEIDGLRNNVGSLRQEIAHAKERLAILNNHATAKKKRNTIVSRLQRRKLASKFLALRSEAEAHELAERRQLASIQLNEARNRLLVSEKALAKAEAEQSLERKRELAKLEFEIQNQKTVVSMARKFINELKLQAHRTTTADGRLEYKIVRQSKRGPQVLVANEMTELNPGDLVRLVYGTSRLKPL